MHLGIGRDLRGGVLGKNLQAQVGVSLGSLFHSVLLNPPPSYPPIQPHDEHGFQLRASMCVRLWDVTFNSKYTTWSNVCHVFSSLQTTAVFSKTFRIVARSGASPFSSLSLQHLVAHVSILLGYTYTFILACHYLC